MKPTDRRETAAESGEARRLEALWGGKFGEDYAHRNDRAGDGRGAFWNGLITGHPIDNVLEVGCNIGANLRWIHGIVGPQNSHGIDISKNAVQTLLQRYPGVNARQGSARELPYEDHAFDLVFTAGVLIHQPDETLPQVMREMVRCSRRYILCAEYYAPSQEVLVYRDQAGALFKRPYGRLFEEQHPELRLVQTGRLSKAEGWDDVTYWLFEKTTCVTDRLDRLFDELWPITRSLMGPGYRQSLDILSREVPLEKFTFKTGDPIYDWTVPKEWTIRDAYILGPDGIKRGDVKKCNLSVVSHSRPVRTKIPLKDLKQHLHTLPGQPDAVPYRTHYYGDNDWGFCLPYSEYRSLPEGDYEVVIDSDLTDGELTIGETVLEGADKREVLLSTYLCHPSMANNELSGPLVFSELYRYLAKRRDRRFTYRFVVVPETLGAIAYLKLRGNLLKERLVAGLQMTCLGGPHPMTYKATAGGGAMIDRVARAVLEGRGEYRWVDYHPTGSDERQYNSQAFRLPVGSLMKTKYGEYREYHTSLDNKQWMRIETLTESLLAYQDVIDAIENNVKWQSTVTHGEPHLSKRDLYTKVGAVSIDARSKEIFWLLHLADGQNDLVEIAKQSKCSVKTLNQTARHMASRGLLKRIDE